MDNFESYVADGHLHLVAPPGSGKTILGLEMIRRLDGNTLILAPTLVIRNQWQKRMLEFFVQDEEFNDFTTNLKRPKRITFSTYQSLYQLYGALEVDSGKEGLLKFIEKHNIKTLVLDEAHHLKNEWWNSLFHLKEIKGLMVVALTATPPYDSERNELDKYFRLCGPIDEEIAVPDLVKNTDLCPHQDFIYFSKPDEPQIRYIVAFRERVMQFVDAIVKDEEFIEILINHPIYKNTNNELERIYEDPAFFSSILIFLREAQIKIDTDKLKVLGFTEQEIDFPSLSYEWLQILIQKLVVDQRGLFTAYEGVLSRIGKELREIGVFESKKVDFIGSDHLYASLANSPSKLRSIGRIVSIEHNVMGESLRMVVLTDFIRKEFLGYTGLDSKELNKLGVISIFQYLRTTSSYKEQLGVLTGSIVILYKTAVALFVEQVNKELYYLTPMKEEEDFFVITPVGKGKNTIVSTITSLFESGSIRILIGTKALLGEGWDAPAINSLLLATYVGSFVSSNQMRGRAIRVRTGHPNKTSNIWHLACLDSTIGDGGKELERLKRRFEAFSGVSLTKTPFIANGLDRLSLPRAFSEEVDLKELNAKMEKIASQRSQLKSRWFAAIENGNVLQRELKVFYKSDLSYKKERQLLSLNMVKYLALEVLVGMGFFLPEFLLKNMEGILQKKYVSVFYLFVVGIMMGFAPKTFKALKLFILFGNTQKRTKKIGKAILSVLLETKVVQTDSSQLEVVLEEHGRGEFTICLKGASQHEGSIFIDLLEEVIAPVENPRYLLINRNWIQRKMGIRRYYVVPNLFGRRKEDAIVFHRSWQKHVGRSKLLYVRSVEGRKELLRARLGHIKYQFHEISRKAISWK